LKAAAALLAGLLLGMAGLQPAHAQNTAPGVQPSPTPMRAVADHIDSPPFVDPRELTRFREGLLFNAWHQEGGQALWWLDPAQAQVRLLTPAQPGFRGTAPGGFVVWDGWAYFRADDGVHGAELWRSDSTVVGTHMVADLLPGAEASTPAFLTVFDGALFFVARDPASQVYRLWRLDAGAAAPARVAAAGALANVRHLTVAGGRLYFSATAANTGNELWVMDRARAAPRLLRDIRNGPEDGMPEQLTPVRTAAGDLLFFAANDGRHGWELWRSDGTRAGTVMVRDIRPGVDASRPRYLQAVGGRVFFAADDGTHGAELWRSDGTAAGTALVRDIRPGAPGSGASFVVACGGRAWFAAHDGQTGLEPWSSDGTSQGTQPAGDLFAGAGSSTPHELSCVGGQLLLAAFAQASYATPWRRVGERFEPLAAPHVAGTEPLAAPSRFTALPGGHMALVARDALGNDRLWLQDPRGPLRRVGRPLLEKWSAGR
jgi:ELWxxDGT repeat protein